MKKAIKCFYASAAVIAGMSMTGCIDDSYDLSDIDTTAEIKVKDLVLPVNLDEIELSNILDLDSESNIKETADGYAMIESGTFTSSPIDIPQIIIGAPAFSYTETTLYPEALPAGMSVGTTAAGTDIYFPIKGGHASSFNYVHRSVSEYIVSMTDISTDWSYKVTLSAPDIAGKVSKFEFRDVVLELPAGMDGTPSHGTYDKATGRVEIPSLVVSDGSVVFSMNVSAINIASAGVQYNYDAHTVVFDGHVGVVSGFIVVNTADITGSTPPDRLQFRSHNVLSDLAIDGFSGEVKYDITGVSVPAINLDDLPDVLAQDGTNIIMSDPQIYLKLNNPVGDYKVYAQTGLTLTAEREGETSKTFSLDNGSFRIGADHGKGPYTYCLALPGKPSKYYEGYEDAEHVDFSGLADVLSGKGIPHTIGVELNNPNIPVQPVLDFRLGKLDAIEGDYLFYVPFALGDGSVIVYTDTEDGWNDEDIEAMTISHLSISAEMTNDLPFDVEITGYPIDVNGNRINNVEIEGALVKSNTTDNPVNIHITGEVKHLDGITFTAVARPVNFDTALSPNQNLKLRNIRAKVSGSYIKEL